MTPGSFARFVRSLCATQCLVCGGSAAGDICLPCLADHFPAAGLRCRRCASRLHNPADTVCGACASHPPPYRETLVLADYTMPVSAMVLALKLQSRLDIAHIFGRLLAERIRDHWALPPATAVLAVPLTPARLGERGYNQARELALALARHAGLPLLDARVMQRGDRPAQRRLNRQERLSNLRGVFRTGARLPECILVVDDVMTTGATLAEVARTLSGAGVTDVYNAVVARTPAAFVAQPLPMAEAGLPAA